MIKIQDKENCCGCSACVQRCLKRCISMHEDVEGFLYPEVDESACIGCGLCEKVCPVINQDSEREPLAVYAAKNPDETVRMQSSSGGVFTMLAENVIAEGGVVFGACFNDDWEVVHSYAEDKNTLEKFRGSKYVQSKVLDTYKEAEDFLKKGRKVLYSGTPCQIAGLKHFLRKDYNNLIAVDVICHGAPSPGVFRTYLQGKINECTAHKGGKNTVLLPCIPLVSERDGLDGHGWNISSISFRDKRNGWKKFGFALVLSKASAAGEKNSVSLSYEPLDKNPFMRGFLHDIYLRPSCYACPAKSLKSGADITLGDWWGIDALMPEIDDDRGVSAVTVNTEKGRITLQNITLQLYLLTYEDLIKNNAAMIRPVAIPNNRAEFFNKDGKTLGEKVRKLAKIQYSWRGQIYYAICEIVVPVVEKIKDLLKRS